MKGRAVVLGIYNVFRPACRMLDSLRLNLSLPYDLIVIHDGLTRDQKFILEKWYSVVRFIDYTEFKNTRLGDVSEFTHMTMARYECFGLLEEYHQVAWVDIDLLFRRNIDHLFENTEGMTAIKEASNLEMNFIDGCIPPLVQLRPQDKERFFNAGFFILNASIPEPIKIRNWCYETTHKYIDQLRFPDQGVLNLAALNFDIPVMNPGLSYNYSVNYCRESLDDPHVYHFFCYPKPWDKGNWKEACDLHGPRWVEEWNDWHIRSFEKNREDIFLVATIGGDLTLLPLFLSYYYHQFKVGKFLIVINALNEQGIDSVMESLSKYPHEKKVLIGEFSEDKKTKLEWQLIDENCCVDSWVIYADLDEFIESPVSLPVLLEYCDHKDMKLNHITIDDKDRVDRVSLDGCFPEFKGNSIQGLNEQFPVRCHITGNVGKAMNRKVIAARPNIRVWYGHHYMLEKCPQNEPPDPSCPIRKKIDPKSQSFNIRMGHFRWHKNTIESMRKRVHRKGHADVEYSENFWIDETQNILDYIDTHGGRLDLEDSLLEVEV